MFASEEIVTEEILIAAGRSGHAVVNIDHSLLVNKIRVESDVGDVQWGSTHFASCTFPSAPTKPVPIREIPALLTSDTKPAAFAINAGIPQLIFLYNPTDLPARVIVHLSGAAL